MEIMDIASLIHEIGQWVIRLAMIPVLARENRPSVAWGWLALFAFVPWLALLMYGLFGKPVLRRRLRRHTRIRTALQERGFLRSPSGSETRLLAPESAELARLVERLTRNSHDGIPAVPGNSAELLTETETTVDRLVADIERAEDHVHLLFYIFNADDTGWRVARALAGAAQRGVKCRVLVDAFGSRFEASSSFFKSLSPWLKEQGVQVSDVLTTKLARRPLARFDLRNHRKIAVLDGSIAYTGSMNVHDADSALEYGEWKQLMVRFEGPVVRQLQLLFVEDWSYAADEHLAEEEGLFPPVPGGSSGVVAQVVPGGPEYGVDPIHHLLVAAMASARERLIITTPYFVPDEPMQFALRVAALRGAQVDLILPRASDRATADAAARAYLEELCQVGVCVHLFPDGLLHAKSMTVDDRIAVLGSANFDRRSLFLNYEANVVIYDATFTAHLRACQEEYLLQSRPLEPGWWQERPRLGRRLDQMAKLLSPLM